MRNLEKYQENYQALPFEETQLLYRRRKVDEIVNKYQPKSILEVGCGMSAYFNHCQPYERFTVIEPGATFFEKAQKEAQRHENTEVFFGTVQDKQDQLKQHQYDLILMTSLLHEISDSDGLLNSVKGLCNHNTIVHISVPNANSFHRLLAVEMGLIEDVHEVSDTQKNMQQTHTFDINSLTKLLNHYGFKTLDAGTFFIKPFTHLQMSKMQQNGLFTKQMLDGLYQLSKHFPENGSELFVDVMLEE